ncbi:MAG: DUF2096 domain-containing protein [Methanosphaera sp.]|nr:DUF2096 domain-containing protein [Methanosphaera sp.]
METQTDPLYCRWSVLDHLLKNLNKKYDLDETIVPNLQQSKTLINYYTDDPTDPTRIKEVSRIDGLLNDIEQKLLLTAENEGEEYTKKWEGYLLDASKGVEVFRNVKIQSHFIAGMPANFDFVRFNFKEHIAEERFMEICEYENVIIEYDEDDKSVFVFGEKPQITLALQEMSSFFAEQMD